MVHVMTGPASLEACLTARQELSHKGVGLASPDDSDTPGRTTCEPERLVGRGPWSRPAELQATQRTSRGGASGGPEPVDIEGTRSWSHGPAAERSELRLGD